MGGGEFFGWSSVAVCFGRALQYGKVTAQILGSVFHPPVISYFDCDRLAGLSLPFSSALPFTQTKLPPSLPFPSGFPKIDLLDYGTVPLPVVSNTVTVACPMRPLLLWLAGWLPTPPTRSYRACGGGGKGKAKRK